MTAAVAQDSVRVSLISRDSRETGLFGVTFQQLKNMENTGKEHRRNNGRTQAEQTNNGTTHTAQTARLFVHTLPLVAVKIVLVKTSAFVFSPQLFRSVLRAFAAQTFLGLCDWYIAIALCVGRAALGERSLCVHTHTQTLRTSLPPWVITEDTHTFLQIMQFDDSQKLDDEKRPGHADSGRKSVKKYDEHFTTITSDALHIFFYDIVAMTNSPTVQVKSVCSRENGAEAPCGPGRCENIIIRVEFLKQ